MKYLVLLIVLAVVVGVWRSRRPPASGPEKAAPLPPGRPPGREGGSRCVEHSPRAEALMLGQHAYCCAEHRRQHSA